MMVIMSKITAILCLLFTIFIGDQLKCGESHVPILPTRVTVEITNRLIDRYLAVRCKDKHNDFGVQYLNVGETFSFRFFPKYYYPSTLFFCQFVWLEGDYYFDIYVQDRDGYCHHNKCSWDIVAKGPCQTDGIRECYGWNPPADEKIAPAIE
ncbi:hypothetical protein PHAVU_004G003400 [Phaseolus vulgaris]|uniref:S-protein homolog n=1 Tax=Phaseolus vulgaris TaxID=3885 RepID=V7C0R6_PHAVU|nr:hypothetical protein PHAVU_004G003400g [Phaseolus vulgaris]ESW22890.1 hypothetical protein PHAVU_004G003400g [Phaseolus vulgaris]